MKYTQTDTVKYCHAADLEIINKNTENRIMNSNKNIVEKTGTRKTL